MYSRYYLGDNRGDYLGYYSHAHQNLLLKWTLTRIRATIIPAIISGIIAGIHGLTPGLYMVSFFESVMCVM